jgi:hypothetical protein
VRRPARLQMGLLAGIGAFMAATAQASAGPGGAPRAVTAGTQPTPVMVRSVEELKALAEDILADRQYKRQMRAEDQVGLAERLWGRLWRWLKEAVRRPLLAGIQQERPILYWAIVVGLVLLLLVILLHFALTLRAALRGGGGPATDGSLDGPSAILRPSDLLSRAERSAAAGHYREAIRLLYLALLSRLDQQGLINYDHTKTNWEYLRTTRSIVTLHRPFLQLTAIFDRKWYGFEPAALADYGECRRLWDQAAAGHGPTEPREGARGGAR